MSAILTVNNLVMLKRRRRRGWFRYERNDSRLLDGISFSIAPAEAFAIVGEEGSGKMALTMGVMGLQPIESGEILLYGHDVASLGPRPMRRLRKRAQAVFSDGFGQLTPTHTVDEAFREVVDLWYPRASRSDRQERLEKVMIASGLREAIRELYPAELDAVERQQVALARALLSEPDLLICHDITRALDAVATAELLYRVLQIREIFSLSLLIVTDDLAVAHHLSDTLAVLHRGRILEQGNRQAIVSHPEHEYTKRLVSCSL
ncbi:MAG: ATP-binding cassette domain-containing protein [Verrucomicrobiota bacterium]